MEKERPSDDLRDELESEKKRKKVESTQTTEDDETPSSIAMDRFYKILTSAPDQLHLFEELVTSATSSFFSKPTVTTCLESYENNLSTGNKNECLALLKENLIEQLEEAPGP